MLPATKLTVGDVLLILRRRAGLVLVIVALVSTATAAGALLLKNRFRSETLILVVPQRVPETYVKSTVTAKIEDRLQSITQEILSRTRLERIIEDFNLYARERQTRLMETIVEDMRKDIDVKVVKGDSFRIAYVGEDATTVMKVTNRLASLFIEENLRDREELAEGTNRFLETQLAEARHRLIEHETKLEAYRDRFSGELPSQLAPNLQMIQNVQLQIQSVTDSMNRDIDRRALTERQLRDVNREIDTASSVTPPARSIEPGTPTTPESAAEQLIAAQKALATMRRHLKSAHPDVLRQERVVRELKAKAEAEDAEHGAHNAAASPVATALEQARAADLKVELEQLDREIQLKSAEEQRLRAIVHGYEERVEHVPARESELAELTRDYSTLQTLYQTLLAKQEDSKIAANLERRQIGAQFRVLDPARVAEKPFSPRRSRIEMIGIAAGLAVGLALVALIEHRDRTFKTAADIRAEFTLPVLAVVSLIESEHEQRRAAKRRFLGRWALGVVVSACLPVIVYSFLH